MKIVRIGKQIIGKGTPPFIIAELGICHEGNVDLALKLAAAAIDAGAHCVKTETFQHETMVFDPSATTSYTINGEERTVPLHEHMEAFQLSLEEHHEIKKYCDTRNVPFISTAHDFKAVDFLCDIGAAGIKIASPDIVHFPLLEYAAQTGLPVVMDSGGALQYEIEIAVGVLRESGLEDIVINHNPAGHPAPAQGHDLAIIPRLQEILQIPIGISDHYAGYEMMYAAAAIGANVLEKPVSEDRFSPMPEKGWSISRPDLAGVYDSVSEIYKAIGNPERTLSNQATQYRDQNRMACAAGKYMKKGDEINQDSIVFGRPREGVGVEFFHIIRGKKLRRDKQPLEFIQWEDLD